MNSLLGNGSHHQRSDQKLAAFLSVDVLAPAPASLRTDSTVTFVDGFREYRARTYDETSDKDKDNGSIYDGHQ